MKTLLAEPLSKLEVKGATKQQVIKKVPGKDRISDEGISKLETKFS